MVNVQETLIKKLLVNDLLPHPENESIYGKENATDLAEKIHQSGWIKTLVVYWREDLEAYTIVSGHRRHAAAKQLGWKEVECEIREFESENAALEFLLLENTYRDKTVEQKIREGDTWWKIEKANSDKRKILAGKLYGENHKKEEVRDNCPEPLDTGRTRDKVAEKVGLPSGKTYERAKAVVDNISELRESGQEELANTVSKMLDKSVSGTKKLIDTVGKEKLAEKITPEIVEEVKSGDFSVGKIVEKVGNKGAHVSNNSGENEWYTPELYIEMARKVMGSIDLDPASSPIANKIVKARVYYDKDTNGLLSPDWTGNVWMNPPYSQPLITDFCEKIVYEYSQGKVKQAIILVNNATETKWFQDLAASCSAISFPKGRVKFWHPDRPLATPLQGQAILYMGSNEKLFIEVFSELGLTLSRQNE